MLRAFMSVLVLATLAGCVASGDVQPMRTEEGRQQARQAYVDLARGYLQEGMTAQAKAPLQSVLEMNSNDGEALEILALVFQLEMEPELAEQYFKRALNASKRDTRTLNNYGGFLLEQQRDEEAYAAFAEASRDTMYMNRARVFENMGITAMRLGRQDDAYDNFRRSLRLDARAPRVLLELGVLSYERQDYPGARGYYQAFTSVSEHNARSLLLGARLARVYEDRDQAASLGLQLRRLYPASAEYQTYRSELP